MKKHFFTASGWALSLLILMSCHQPWNHSPRATKEVPPVEVKAEVDKAIAATGDLIRYTLTATSEPSIRVELPEMGSHIAGLRIVDMGETEPFERDGRTTLTKWYQLKADLVGSYIIPGAVFVSYDEKGNKEELKTAQIFIEVKSVIDTKDTASDIRDIKPLATMRRDYALVIILSLSGAALITLIFGGIYWYHLNSRKAKAPPLRPAHELALEELKCLRQEGLIEKGGYKEHYFKLSEIFRRYLERRFHFPAVERTTEEIFPEISNLKGFDERLRYSVHNFLALTDLVKFAKRIPTAQEAELEYQEAVDFINETKEDMIQPAPSSEGI